ncbi:hypothetical protein NE236_39530 [Actinoallomurus purpureus]|uniref:hypothetical protein n=1 Tax=Actinoallomurus purpureus TaxID=478114 RepID=UPI00209378FD|nr:hypothetical protein [Actinoallomurus purpureus]MCO6011065.1 hypothetical protein [Actinoallomurus purpureus]
MFRRHPEFAVEVLRELKGVDVPEAASVQVESNDFNDRPSKDFQPDTVITVGPPQATLHGIIMEVQQEKTESKRRQLPRYAAQLWLMLRRPVTVLCVCPDPDAAAYYAEPIATELPGYVFRAVVLGPNDVPIITDPAEAAAHPELAAMGVMMHGRQESVLKAFVNALEVIEPDNAPQYLEYAYNMAAAAVRRILEELVSSTSWPVYSPFAKQHFGRGKAEGEVHAVLTVLEARGIEVPASARARINACTDLQELDVWLKKAGVVQSVDELFG